MLGESEYIFALEVNRNRVSPILHICPVAVYERIGYARGYVPFVAIPDVIADDVEREALRGFVAIGGLGNILDDNPRVQQYPLTVGRSPEACRFRVLVNLAIDKQFEQRLRP
jgi:hypothetical protein